MFSCEYWPTYKRIEQEVIDLSYSIYFDDSQTSVYSNQVSDLIIHISTNIESLYEDIYRSEFGGTEPEIGSMIKKLGETFSLEEKIINKSLAFHVLRWYNSYVRKQEAERVGQTHSFC